MCLLILWSSRSCAHLVPDALINNPMLLHNSSAAALSSVLAWVTRSRFLHYSASNTFVVIDTDAFLSEKMQQALLCEILTQGTRPCGIISAIERKKDFYYLFMQMDWRTLWCHSCSTEEQITSLEISTFRGCSSCHWASKWKCKRRKHQFLERERAKKAILFMMLCTDC